MFPGNRHTFGRNFRGNLQMQPQMQPQMAAYQPPAADEAFLFHIFSQVDINKSGRISARELQIALSNGNWMKPFNPETIQMMIALFDHNGDFSIDFLEFHRLWMHILQWQTAFITFDQNRSGSINFTELRNCLWASGYQVTDQFCGYVMMKMDRTKSHRLHFDDFIKLCISMQMLTASFNSKDPFHTGAIQLNYEEFLCMALLPRI